MYDLDRTDRRILTELQKDGRLSNKELAARVHLAPSSCHGRFRRLQEIGALRGFHAEVDPRALGVELRTLVLLRMSDHAEKHTRALREFLLSHPEVCDIFHVTGHDDLVLQVAVRDTDHLRELIIDRIGARSEVADIHTLLIFDHLRSPGYPDLA
jgi:DNA-binding Lrp family transcriptional regulator